VTLSEITNLHNEAKRLHAVNQHLDPELPEELYFLELNIKKLKQIEDQLDRFITAEEGTKLRLVGGGE
jgi:hypothetical protein